MFEEAQKHAIVKIAKNLNVPPASLLAVIEVESGGKSHARVNDKDEPVIRFEGHYFDRFLKGETREEARRQGLASPVPGRVKNPRSQQARWKLLSKAIAVNRTAALSSCSWGLGQVMGAHWKWLGYGSVDAMVTEARSGIVGQVKIMARYVEKAGLCQALRDQDWPKFARVYNGPAYAKNRYDSKMADAFHRYASLETSPVLPEAATEEEHAILKFGSRGHEVVQLQKSLSAAGYMLNPDGLFGLITDRVVRQFQRDHLLDATGIVGDRERSLIFGKNAASGLASRFISNKTNGPNRTSKNIGALSRKFALTSGQIGHNIRNTLLSISRRFA